MERTKGTEGCLARVGRDRGRDEFCGQPQYRQDLCRKHHRRHESAMQKVGEN